MERLVGGAIRRKLEDAAKNYKGGDKPAMKLSVYKNMIKALKKKKKLSGGASGSSWMTPWKWDADDWKAAGVGLAYGVDAVVMGSLNSKTVKQLIKTAVATGTSAQLVAMGITLPPSVVAMGTDQAVDAFIAGLVWAHDYVVGDNPYRKQVDEFFVEVDKYAPQVIKGIEMASNFTLGDINLDNIVQKGDIMGMGIRLAGGGKHEMSSEDRMSLIQYLLLVLGAMDVVMDMRNTEKAAYKVSPRIAKAFNEIYHIGVKYNLIHAELARELEKRNIDIEAVYDDLEDMFHDLNDEKGESRVSFAPINIRRRTGSGRFSPDAQQVMIKMFQQKRLKYLDDLMKIIERDMARLNDMTPHELAKFIDDEAQWQKLYELHNRYVFEGRGKSVEIPMKEFKAEHKELADVLAHPTKEKLDKELAKQTEEVSKVVGKGMDLLGMSEAAYMKKAKSKAKKAGYDPKKLSMCSDGVHKLDYDGVKFGRVGYGDHILYSFLEKSGEAPKGTASKKRKVFRASHSAMKDSGKGSANQLALAILW